MPDNREEPTGFLELSEDSAPAPGLQKLTTRPIKREHTRRTIAYILVGTLVALAIVGAAGWLFFGEDTDRMQNFAVVFSPVTTLIGTVIGFYFSSTADSN